MLLMVTVLLVVLAAVPGMVAPLHPKQAVLMVVRVVLDTGTAAQGRELLPGSLAMIAEPFTLAAVAAVVIPIILVPLAVLAAVVLAALAGVLVKMVQTILVAVAVVVPVVRLPMQKAALVL